MKDNVFYAVLNKDGNRIGGYNNDCRVVRTEKGVKNLMKRPDAVRFIKLKFVEVVDEEV